MKISQFRKNKNLNQKKMKKKKKKIEKKKKIKKNFENFLKRRVKESATSVSSSRPPILYDFVRFLKNAKFYQKSGSVTIHHLWMPNF